MAAGNGHITSLCAFERTVFDGEGGHNLVSDLGRLGALKVIGEGDGKEQREDNETIHGSRSVERSRFAA
jgi:hypothetical protein